MASKKNGKGFETIQRLGEVRVQVDRWPLTDDDPTPHALTIITAALYNRKPDQAAIVAALRDAISIFEVGEIQ